MLLIIFEAIFFYEKDASYKVNQNQNLLKI